MSCSTCGGGRLHGMRCPVLESKLRTVLVILVVFLGGAALLEQLGARIGVRRDIALGIVALMAAAWLLVRRAVRRDHDPKP
ncbi:MAG: hypothetical protein ACR2HM_11430 [Acidimicrobiales bacterium]